MAADESGLLEREWVLEALARHAAAARAGVGRAALVHGEPGAGKTSVLRAAAATCAASGDLILAARGSELEQQMPWSLARALLRAPAADQPALAGPVAAAALGHPGAEVTDEVAALHELAELVLALAAERPLALVADDAHWADAESARLLAFLAGRIERGQVLLLLAARPDDPRRPPALATLAAHDAVDVMPLASLSPGAVAALVAALVPAASPEVAAACHAATHGNAFLATELARELAALSDAPDPERVAELRVDAIDRAVTRRLAASGPDATAFAQAAAILGDAMPADAAALAGLTDAAAATAADALRAVGVLSADAGVSVAHPLLLAAVRRGIPPGRRSQLHLAAARRLDATAPADRVGAHLLAVEPGNDAWVRDRLVAAADAALTAGAPSSAVALLQRALAERAGGPDPALLARLGRAALPLDPALAEPPLRGAVDATPDPQDRVPAALALATVLQLRRRSAEATELLFALDEDLAAADAPRSLRLRVQAEALAQSFFDPATRSARDARLPDLLEGLDGSCEEELLIRIHAAVGAVDRGTAAQVRALTAAAWADGALARVAGAPETPTVMWVPYLHLYTDDPGWTAALMEDWVSQARARGSAVLAVFAHALLGQAHLRSGALADAGAAAAAAWTTATEFGPGFPGWWIASGTLLDAHLASGDVTAARALADRTGLLDGDPPDVMLMPAPRVVRARVLLACGDLEAGATELEAAWDWIAAEEVVSPGAWWFPADLVDGLLATGRRARALEVAHEWLARTERFGAASTLGQAQRAVGLAVGGEDALPWLERAVATLAASPARAEHARALLELGAALRRLRRAREAREPLREALDLATSCGAAGVAGTARTELTAAGARPRREALQGPDALTAAERRVVALAAAGRTNREIADSLFISRKTVERHLGNAYLKLGTNDRSTLREIVAGAG